MKNTSKTLLLATLMGISICGFAQSPGSVSLYGGGVSEKNIFSGTYADVSETVYIGPGTHTINGTWQIYAKKIIVSSAAVVVGTGTIEIYNPSAAGGAAGTTLTDGNYNTNTVSVNVQLNNASGMQLANMNLPAELTSAGWTEQTSASSLALDKQLDLNTDGANVTLGAGTRGDLVFTANGTISNYSADRMIITNNSIVSHVVKQNYTSGFVFPVGIAGKDYSPAQISNASAIDVNVSVQDYTASASDESVFGDYGMRRTWHIYGSAAGTGSNITLQHSSLLDEPQFSESRHFVTQYSNTSANNSGDNFGTTPWQENTPGAAGAAGSFRKTAVAPGLSSKSRSYASLPARSNSNFAYFSKRTSTNQGALPIKIISFNAVAQGCNANIKLVAELDSDVRAIELQRGSNALDFSKIHDWVAFGTNGAHEFVFNDKAITSGKTYYYRVKVSYNTGSSEYSNTAVVKVDCNNAQRVMLFPNPANGFIYVQGLPANVRKTIQVTDMSGKTWKQISTSDSGKRLNIQGLPGGIYVIRIFNQDGTVYFLSKFSKM